MTSRALPTYVTAAIALTIVIVAIVLSVFYSQFQWLNDASNGTNSTWQDSELAVDFEQRAGTRIKAAATSLANMTIADDDVAALRILDRTVAESGSLAGLRFSGVSGNQIQTGEPVDADQTSAKLWTENHLFLAYPVTRLDAEIGMLTGSFELSELRQDISEFHDELLERRRGFLWMSSLILTVLVLGGIAILLVARTWSTRIHELKSEAQKLSDSDFGQPILVKQDELGELASVFNSMRNKLRRSTISRDYVDSVLSSMNEAIIVSSVDGIIQRINRATALMLGYKAEELVQQPIEKIIDQQKGGSLDVGSSSAAPRETWLLSKTGESIPVSYTGSIVETQYGKQRGDRIFAAQNITERRRAEKRIRYLARIDALTKIPNRMQFQHLLQRAIARAKRSGKSLYMLYIDVDHFKDINDTFGHLAGDTTLETVAERLTNSLPPNSVCGRLAGDEFAVIVDDLEGANDTKEALNKLARTTLDRLADPFFVQGHEVFMTASMGIASYPTDARDVIDLIRNADAALYQTKKNGGNDFCYYDPAMNEAAVERLITKSKLKRSFERNELLVHYQPKYNISTGEMIGAEALVRWELPDRGIILPANFIPIAEESNLIIEIGEWVLDRVCEDFRYWQRSVPSPGRISVNLSLKQLRQTNFINRISSTLRSHEVSPTSLELEITETTLMEDTTRTIKFLDELYSLGLHLAIDDFGTGYSSLSALQQFPISTLKIDQSFVRDVAFDADDATIVGTIIKMGQSLDMDVVAEGVETEEQLNILQTMQCTFVQGLLFGNPMSSDNYLELLLAQAEGTDSHRALFA
jgi:diguanylate cyclase (GGDEF)-like protein/PAS domain S-box-containing protein